jgi:hypothetical protein
VPCERSIRFFALPGCDFVFLRAKRNSAASSGKKRTVVSGNEKKYTKAVMNAVFANSYRWYRFTGDPSRWRGAFL